MPTGVENLLGYKGNVGFGLGASPEIPAIDPNANTNVINDIGKNIMLLNAERNAKLYQQKVKDRDTMLDLLAAGKIASGEIDDKGRKIYDEAEKKQIEAFHAIKGINDQQGLENYMKATNELKNVTTHAQGKNILLKQLKDQLAKSTLPSEQAALKKHIQEQESKPFWGSIDPYQQHLTFDHGTMNTKLLEGSLGGVAPITPTATGQKTTVTTKDGKTSTTQTATTAAAKGITPAGTSVISKVSELSPLSTTEKVYDYGKILANSTDSYLHDEQIRHDQDMWRNSIETGDAYSAKSVIDFTNKRIEQYNQERGFQPGQQGYVSPIVIGKDIVQDPSGRFHINMPTSEFAAKTALASVDGPYVQRQTDFNKNIADYLLAAKKEKDANILGWARLNENIRKNKAALAAMQPEDVTPFLKNEWVSNFTSQKTPVSAAIPANESMPVWTFKNGKPDIVAPIGGKPIYQIGGKNANGERNPNIPNNEKDKIIGYEGGRYDRVIFNSAGKQVSMEDITDMYSDYMRSALKAGYKKEDIPTLNEFINTGVKDGPEKGGFSYAMKGKDQMVTEAEYIAAQKALSNLLTKSKQQGIFTGLFSEDQSYQTPEE